MMNEEIFQRISALEVLISKYHDEIKKYKEHQQTYDLFIKDMPDFDKEISQIKIEVEKIKGSSIDIQMSNVMQNLKTHSDKIDMNYNDNVDFKKQYKNFCLFIYSEFAEVSKQFREFYDLHDKHTAKGENFDQHKDQVNDQIRDIQSKIPSLIDQSNEIKTKHIELRDLMEIISAHAKNTRSMVEQLSDKVQKQSTINQLHTDKLDTNFARTTDLYVAITDVHSELSQEIRDVKNSIEKPKDFGPEIAALRKEIMPLVELLAMDVKNCILRASNLDVQNKLTDKKIETINLYLKKHELMQ